MASSYRDSAIYLHWRYKAAVIFVFLNMIKIKIMISVKEYCDIIYDYKVKGSMW